MKKVLILFSIYCFFSNLAFASGGIPANISHNYKMYPTTYVGGVSSARVGIQGKRYNPGTASGSLSGEGTSTAFVKTTILPPLQRPMIRYDYKSGQNYVDNSVNVSYNTGNTCNGMIYYDRNGKFLRCN